MNCQEFESTLNLLLDHRKHPHSHAGLTEHANECEFCAETIEIYSAIGEFGEYCEPSRNNPLQARRRFTSYVAAVTAAAVLFLLLTPLGDFYSSESGKINMAHANSQNFTDGHSDGLIPGEDSANSYFWNNRPLATMVPLGEFAMQVPRTPSFQDVGQSINSVWQSIQEDEFLLPIIKQGALFWMPLR